MHALHKSDDGQASTSALGASSTAAAAPQAETVELSFGAMVRGLAVVCVLAALISAGFGLVGWASYNAYGTTPIRRSADHAQRGAVLRLFAAVCRYSSSGADSSSR